MEVEEYTTLFFIRRLIGMPAKEVEADLGWTKGRLGQCESGHRQLTDREKVQLLGYYGVSRRRFNKFHLELLLFCAKL